MNLTVKLTFHEPAIPQPIAYHQIGICHVDSVTKIVWPSGGNE